MILDLDQVEPRRSGGVRPWLFPLVTGLLLAGFGALALFGPAYDRPLPAPAFDRGGALAARSLADSPDVPRMLALPREAYTRATPFALTDGILVNISPTGRSARQVRYILRDGRDLLVVQLPTDPRIPTSSVVTVRGTTGFHYPRERGSVLLWSEGGTWYELGSLTLGGTDLVLLAERLR